MWSVLKYKKLRVLARVIVAIGRVILIIVYNDDQIKKGNYGLECNVETDGGGGIYR